MSTGEDHERLARDLERETDRLQKESERLGGEISDVRSDWETKRQDPAVPGAPLPEQSEPESEDRSGAGQTDAKTSPPPDADEDAS